MANRDRTKLKFSRLVAKGENANDVAYGFCGVNVNGTLRAGNQSGWNQDIPYEPTNIIPTTKGGSGHRKSSSAEKRGPWKIGNRTGE